MNKSLLSLLCSSVLLSASNEYDLMSLSLEELLTVEVYTASQNKEKAASSTAAITVITAEQLREWGIHSVYEALRYVPGVSVNESYMGYSVATFRGITPGLFNSKALFMVDGHPVHEKVFGSSHAEFVPIEAIERIEIVRSPSSVLYGTNAISGVVNIITRDNKKIENMAALRGGSYDHAYGAIHYHEDALILSGSYLEDSGYPYRGINDERGVAVDFPYSDRLGNLYARYSNDGWDISGGYYQEKYQKFGQNPILDHHGPTTSTGYLLDIHKTIPVGANELHVWGRYDRMEKKLEAPIFPSPAANGGVPASTAENTVDRYSTELQFKGKINENNGYIVGATYEDDRSSPFKFIFDSNGALNAFSPYLDAKSIQSMAGYGQVNGKINEDFSYNIGARFENNSITGNSGFLPRAGLTYEVQKEQFLKVMYSEAYRSPAFLELHTNVPDVLLGDINLKREKIRTIEMGYEGAINPSNSLQVTLYYTELNDDITRIPMDETDSSKGVKYANCAGIEMYGMEVQWLSMLTSDIELTLNGSWMDGKQKPLNETPFISNYMANAMATYHYNSHLTTTALYHYEGAKEYILTDGSRGRISDYSLVDLVSTYRVDKHEIGVNIKNILDKTYFVPENVRQNIPQLPGGPGRTGYLTYRYYF